MSGQITSAVVHQPLDRMQQRLDDVQSWDQFLTDVEGITRVAHERYLVRLPGGRESLIVVRREGRRHRFRWWALRGPAFEGRIELESVDPTHTRITLAVSLAPHDLAGQSLDLAALQGDPDSLDLDRLERPDRLERRTLRTR